MLNIALSGTNTNSAQTTYGAYISNTHAGTTSTNVGLYATASGGTTANYAAIFNGGNVGIGTATPATLLYGYQNIAGTDATIEVQNAVAKGAYFITNANSNYSASQYRGTGAAWAVGQINSVNYTIQDATNNKTPFTIVQNAPSNSLYIKSSGNVGIGTTSPSYTLDVSGSDTSTSIGVTNRSSTGARWPQVTISDYTGGNGGDATLQFEVSRGSNASTAAVQSGDGLGEIAWYGVYDGSNDAGEGAAIIAHAEGTFSATSWPESIRFYTTASGSNSLTERMRINSTGNVGIGTTTPGQPLTVFGTTNWGVAKIIGNGTNVDSSLGFRSSDVSDGGTGSWVIGPNVLGLSTGAFNIASGGSSVFTILTGGNVGIGTTSPIAPLTVAENGTGASSQLTLVNSHAAAADVGSSVGFSEATGTMQAAV